MQYRRCAAQTISLDDIVIEELSEAPAAIAVEDVRALDTFARGKVLNFLKRQRAARGITGAATGDDVFETEDHNVDGQDVVRCRVRLVLPAPHDAATAEGTADNAKDAEVLAAMHAERIIDALGHPIYRLSSTQQKHAQAAREAGRWAPMPEDEMKPFGTALPPPLRKLTFGASASPSSQAAPRAATAEPSSSDVGEAGESDHVCGAAGVLLRDPLTAAPPCAGDGRSMLDATEGGAFQLAYLQATRFALSDKAMSLPCVFDKAAKGRVQGYYAFHGRSLESELRVTHAAVAGATYRMFLAELSIEGSVVARGKALERENAVHLAAMHAELTIDYLGHALFPADAAAQLEHARLVKGIGRWATSAGDTTRPTEDPRHAPLALKQHVGLVGENEMQFVTSTSANASAGERIVALHNALINGPGCFNAFVEVTPAAELRARAVELLEAWQRRQGNHYPGLYMLSTRRHMFRASVVLPVAARHGVRGGHSVGRTAQLAIELAALQAIDVLALLGIPVLADPAEQAAFDGARRAEGLPVATDFAGADKAPLSPPGYYCDRGADRPMPCYADVERVMRLQVDGLETGMDAATEGDAKAVLDKGIAAKREVTAYLARHGMGGEPVTIQTMEPAMEGGVTFMRNILFLNLHLPPPQSADQTTAQGRSESVLAVGYGLKKKDADRTCFLHAAAIYAAYGVDVTSKAAEPGAPTAPATLPPPLQHPLLKAHLVSEHVTVHCAAMAQSQR
jgi:hypothetical protein